MKITPGIAALAVLLVLGPSPCFALWEIVTVTKNEAKELGAEVHSTAAGPNAVRVELEFKVEGKLKDFSHVDLRIGGLAKPLATASLKEDRSKPGLVVVGFSADHSYLDKITLCVMAPEILGGTIYEFRVKDFVEPKKDR